MLLALLIFAHPPPLTVKSGEHTFDIALEAGTDHRLEIIQTSPTKTLGVMLNWAEALAPGSVQPFKAIAAPGGTNAPLPKEILVTGSGQDTLNTVARAVKLSPFTTGLLVDQWHAGGKAAHFLFEPHNGKLERAWSYEEKDGPHWSSAAVVRLDKNHEGVVLFTARSDGALQSSTTDHFDVRLLRQDENTRAITDTRDISKARLAVIEAFATLSEAYRARDGNACFKRFLIVPSTQLNPPGGKGPFVLVMLAANDAGANRLLKQVKGCAQGYSGRVSALALHSAD